jgi:hypothetical protein
MSSELPDSPTTPSTLLNILLGFLSVVFVVLLIAITTRILYPQVRTERSGVPTHLIGNVIQLQVLNGAGTSGLATSFTDKLRRSGFDVVETGNFESYEVTHTFVIDRSGNLENARRVARSLGIEDKHIIREVSAGYFLDATVVIGADHAQLNLK